MQRGVTLIELLVSIAILAVVTTAVIAVWIALQNSYGYTVVSSRQREAARDGMTLLARELRDVQTPTLGSAVPAIQAADAYRMAFFTTFHTEGAEDPTAQSKRVEYMIRPDSENPAVDVLVRRIDTGAWNVVAKDIRNMKEGVPLFTCLSQAGSTIALPASSEALNEILTIRIQLLVDENPGRAPSVMTLTTTVQPRNLRST